jgi:hypothetical protein
LTIPHRIKRIINRPRGAAGDSSIEQTLAALAYAGTAGQIEGHLDLSARVGRKRGASINAMKILCWRFRGCSLHSDGNGCRGPYAKRVGIRFPRIQVLVFVVCLALPAHPWRWIAPDLEKGGFMFNRLATMRHSSILILAAAVTSAGGISARGQTESKKGYKYI